MNTVIPEPIAQLQNQLDQIRSTEPRGRKLPESVWQTAVELAENTVCMRSRTRYGWTIWG